ncbi:PE domain-containing protein [Nocardia sp. alder85J]|uniref:PE domain-containing protein n=1 Tax=Nocardia sp. alder85J TaxID=2862949 RepID=UPI001CD36956|nr:PE domain-containing protein [Nocardia sp. alder85J]MCX4092193.1 PE domain-containing protein [Nocardia sp. alder85J]
MALEVTPEDFPAVMEQLLAVHTDLMGVVQGTSVAAKPVAAASDPVSQNAAVRFAAYHAYFYAQTSPGLGNLLEGAQMLVPVSTEYTSTEVAGGGVVTASGAGLAGEAV